MISVAEAVRLRPAVAPPISVECVDDFWGFTALRPQWNELLRSSGADNPFLTWEWLYAWWKHLRGSGTLRLITVRAGHQLIAVAPLFVSRHSLAWFSRVEFLGTGPAGSDYLDLIIRHGREAESLEALSQFLTAEGLAVRLDHVLPDSQASRLAARLQDDGWHAEVAPGGVCPVIPLAGHTWDSYLATVGPAHRANIRRRLRAIAQRFHVGFEPATTEAERREALEALAAFHERRWENRGGSTTFMTAALRAFHVEATRRAHDRGWLRMYVLRLDGEIAGVMYGFLYNRRFYFYQHGFDDRYRQHSVGLVLMSFTVRAAIESGAEEFDMLWGVEAYKDLWARDRRPLHRIHLYPDGAGGRLHRHAADARRGLGRLVRTLRSGGTRAS